MSANNAEVIAVLKQAIWHEQERIRRAQAEIFRLESQLYDLGVELPLPLANEARTA